MSRDGHEPVARVLRRRAVDRAGAVPGVVDAMKLKPHLLEMLIINFLVWAIIIAAVLQ